MSVMTIMAQALDLELQSRGVWLEPEDCERILQAMVERSAKIAAAAIEAKERAGRGIERTP